MIYLDDILAATHGTLHAQGRQALFSAFSHDSRQVSPGELFVAVRGSRGNGHDHLTEAIRCGASGLLIEAQALPQLGEAIQSAWIQNEVAVIVVENTRLALQAYAYEILRKWQPVVIAVAGSVGKTSTKEAIATVLESYQPTFRSWQNYNDLLGIPLSLGRLTPDDRFAVLELGCDHPGEIADLCRMICPQIGVLTNISPVQLQYFGTLEHLTQELGTLLNCLNPGGHLFYNQDDALICQLLETQSQVPSVQELQLTYHPLSLTTPVPLAPSNHSSIFIHVASNWQGLEGLLKPIIIPAEDQPLPQLDERQETVTLRSQLLGEHHFYTMLTAYAVGHAFGVSSQAAQQALASVRAMPGRLSPLTGIENARLLDDTHNASPASMLAGLKTLDTLTPVRGRRIAVLGDMLSLGDATIQAHRSVGEHVATMADFLVTYGEYAALYAEAARQAGLSDERIIITATHEDAASVVRQLLQSRSEGTTSQVNTAGRRDSREQYDVVLIKGSEEARMERVTEMLMARPWEASEQLVRQAPGWKKTIFRHAERPTWLEVDLNAIGSNTRHMASLVGPAVKILVALKADAYGHGADKVARTVLYNGANMLGVATVSEAIPLREAAITAPILVFGYIPHLQMREAVRLDVTTTLYSHESAQELSRTAQELGKTVKVHVKVDTGMGRLGIRYENQDEILDLLRSIQSLPGLTLEGLYTHFAQADAADQKHVRLQLARFQELVTVLDKYQLRPPIVHAANSAAALTIPEAQFDMVRPGIAIYGLHPSSEVRLPDSFRPALSFKTQVSQVKWLPEGEGVSYGSTYVTTKPTRIAVLPVGYADGFRRAPRNWGVVLIRGQLAPILGRVCMDQCMVDVTHIPQVRMGDEVVLIGRQGEAALTAEQVAEQLGTINYEVVSEILARVPRV